MRPFLKTTLLAAALALSAAAGRADEWRLGLAAPLDGPFAVLGSQMRNGAEMAARAAGVSLTVAGDDCSAEGGRAAARQLEAAGAAVIVGFLCQESLEAALAVLAEAQIAVITPAVRANGLTDRRARTGWPVWRLAPRADAEARAIADIVPKLWRAEHFAIVDDGTIHGRELAESLRLAAELAALKPVFVDTYRPQMENQIGLVGRLARAGAARVFVGGDRDDIAVMARDAAQLGHDMLFAGGEALRAASEVPLAAGTLMIAPPEPADRLTRDRAAPYAEAGIVPEGYTLPAQAAAEIAIAARRLAADERRAIADVLADVLASRRFETVIGPVSFDDKGDLAQSPFVLHRYDGGRFVPAE